MKSNSTSKRRRASAVQSRREFLAAASVAVLAARCARGAVAANERLALGFIGVGTYGRALIAQNAGVAAALCDVDERQLHRAAALTQPGVRLYRDYRALLDQDDLDGIVIATPDHWHALQAIHACEAGKAVFIAAPACHRLAESAALLRAARRSGAAVHIDSPSTLSAGGAALVRAAQDGTLGALQELNASGAPNRSGGETKNAQAPPPQLDWDAWLGPKFHLAYNPDYARENFRWMRALGGGRICGEGVHAFDLALACRGDDAPLNVKVSATGTPQQDGMWDCPRTLDVTFEFESPKWTLHWKQSPDATDDESCTLRVHGEKGEAVMRKCDTQPTLESALNLSGAKEKANAVSPLLQWCDAVRDRNTDTTALARACRAAQLAQLGNLAYQLQRPVTWREADGHFVDDAQADRTAAEPAWMAWR